MAPKRPPASGPRPAHRNLSDGGQKSMKATPANTNTRARARHSRNTSGTISPPSGRVTRSSIATAPARSPSSRNATTDESLPREPAQEASTTSEDLPQPQPSSRWKRRRAPKLEGASKRRRKQPPPTVEPAPSSMPLNRQNLEKLNGGTQSETSDGMRGNKRSRSQRSSGAGRDQDTASRSSQKSSFSLSDYRLIALDRARIVIRHGDLPAHIQSRIDRIIQRETSDEWKRTLFSITDALCDAFPEVLEVASREDDSVELISRALEDMGRQLFRSVFAFRRKADWEPTLKPHVQRKSYHVEPPAGPNNSANESLGRWSKRQQAQPSSIPLERPEGSMAPPPPPPKPDAPWIKTPRPDITIGFHHAVVAEKLRTLGVGVLDADEILKDLQYDQALYSSPTQPALLVRFPSLVVEGKSYATGRSIYEAENQAAGSGSCMLVVQEQLAALAARRAPSATLAALPDTDSLAFSICSEGPVMLLWVHYPTVVQGARFYNMHLLETCHATRRNAVREFFRAVAGVMEWARSELLDAVAQQLFLVWQASQPLCIDPGMQHESAGGDDQSTAAGPGVRGDPGEGAGSPSGA